MKEMKAKMTYGETSLEKIKDSYYVRVFIQRILILIWDR